MTDVWTYGRTTLVVKSLSRLKTFMIFGTKFSLTLTLKKISFFAPNYSRHQQLGDVTLFEDGIWKRSKVFIVRYLSDNIHHVLYFGIQFKILSYFALFTEGYCYATRCCSLKELYLYWIL